MYSGFVKLLVSFMNPVPYAKPTIAGVKPGGKQVRHIVFVEFVIAFCLLEVMEVVELRGEVKREVVTTVGVHHLQMMCSKEKPFVGILKTNLKLDHAEPEPSNWQGSSHEQNPRTH